MRSCHTITWSWPKQSTINMYYTAENPKSCEIVSQIHSTNRRFKKACQVIVLMNNKLEALQKRYDRARRDDRRSFRYNVRLRLCTVEGARNMIYEYASMRADEMEELQDKLETSEDEFYSSDESESDDSHCWISSIPSFKQKALFRASTFSQTSFYRIVLYTSLLYLSLLVY